MHEDLKKRHGIEEKTIGDTLKNGSLRWSNFFLLVYVIANTHLYRVNYSNCFVRTYLPANKNANKTCEYALVKIYPDTLPRI